MAISSNYANFPGIINNQQFKIPASVAQQITPATTETLKNLLGSVFEMGRQMGMAQQAGILPNPQLALQGLMQQGLPPQFQGMPSFTDRMASPGYGQAADQAIIDQLKNRPLFTPDEAQLMQRLPPEEQAMHTLMRKMDREALFPTPMPPGAPLFNPDEAQLMSKLSPEHQAGFTLSRMTERGMIGPQLTPDQMQLLSKLPPNVQQSFLQGMQQQFAQQPMQGQQFMPQQFAPQQFAPQVMPQQFNPAMMQPQFNPMMQPQFNPALMQQQFNPAMAQVAQMASTAVGIGAGSGAAVAAGAGFVPTGMNPAGNSNAGLVNQIANAPLFSPDEAQLMSKLPPEQQAMMTLQAKKQRESLMTSILTNIANMKHESLKGIAQNLRG